MNLYVILMNTMFKKGGEETDSKMNETQKKDSMLDKAAFH